MFLIVGEEVCNGKKSYYLTLILWRPAPSSKPEQHLCLYRNVADFLQARGATCKLETCHVASARSKAPCVLRRRYVSGFPPVVDSEKRESVGISWRGAGAVLDWRALASIGSCFSPPTDEWVECSVLFPVDQREPLRGGVLFL